MRRYLMCRLFHPLSSLKRPLLASSFSDPLVVRWVAPSSSPRRSIWSDIAWDVRFPQGDQTEDPSEFQSTFTPLRDPADLYIPVKAVFISRQINLKALAEEEFDGTIFARHNLVIKWKDRPPGCPPKPDLLARGLWSSARYMVAFSYGSVVFFNFGEKEEDECLPIIRKHCANPCEEERKDDYKVVVRPSLDAWSERAPDTLFLRELDIENLRVVSSVLGQSVALDHHLRKIDDLVEQYKDLNRQLEVTGRFNQTGKELMQIIADTNSTLADLIVRVRLLERRDHEAMTISAELDTLDEQDNEDVASTNEEEVDANVKLFEVENVEFCLEVLHNKASHFKEYVIIIFLSMELSLDLLAQYLNGG